MGTLDRGLRNRYVLGGVFLLCLTCLLLNAPGKVKEPPPDTFSTRYDYLMSWRSTDVEDLASWFVGMQEQFLGIAPPDREPYVQTGIPEILPFYRKSFPQKFRKGLIAERQNGVQVYPVTIIEDPDTGEVVFFNSNTEEIYVLDPPDDYNPEWYLLEVYPDIYGGGFSEEMIEWLRALLDPARIQVSVTLLPTDSLEQFLYNEAAVASAEALIQSSTDGGMFLMSGGAETNQLHFVQIGRTGTNGEVVVTAEYPGAYAGGVWELFSYDFPWTATGETATFMGLDSVWDIAETNLVLQTGTNRTSWTDSGQWGRPAPETSQYHRAYSACNSHDQDEDGLSDGWEQLSSKTSTTDEDSDDDGLNDGDEVKVHGTDPLDSDSDDDTLSDATEVANRTDPWNDDTVPPSVVLSIPPHDQVWRILP